MYTDTMPSTDPSKCHFYYSHSQCFEADAWNETMTRPGMEALPKRRKKKRKPKICCQSNAEIPDNPICVLQAGNWTGWTSAALDLSLLCAEVILISSCEESERND